ncbi:MAG TPA: thiamine-phosphate kinase [Chroococcidiopsis sp.]
MSQELQLRDIGEQGLLARLQAFCPAEMMGDDAALLSVSAGRSLVVSADMLVDGVHFSVGMANPALHTTTPADVGWRSAAANLSDLAAMGADPLGITVCLGLPDVTPVAWVEQLYQGLSDCLRPFHTPIVGGDICRSTVLTVAITAFGQVSPDCAIHRSQARPGDAILVTGGHGAARAGLELLLDPERGLSLADGDRQALIAAHQRPRPRLDAIAHLRQLSPGPSRIAGMDSSDGLADAVLQICRASGVGARLERRAIPLPTAVQGWLSPEQALEWALYGGEDFELVLCLPVELAEQAIARIGDRSAIVGTITADTAVVLQDSSGGHADESLSLDRGFQHFAADRAD